MEKNREARVWSPVATVEDIQKRLLRPPSRPHSQPSSSFLASQRRDRIISQISSQFEENSCDLLKEKEQKKKKKREVTKIGRLEDYLDPVLLSTIRAKVGSKRNNCGYGAEFKKKSTKCESEIHAFDLFEWPGSGDHVFTDNQASTRVKPDDAKNEVVDLNID